MNKSYDPKQLFIEEGVRNEPLTRHVLEKLSHIKPQYFTADEKEQFEKLSIRDGKEVLVIAQKKGRFLKSCPGTQESLCCGYFILESQSNCNYDCTYCILQTYLNNPPLIVYANLQDMFQELDQIFKMDSLLQYRIGTGELSDSLSLDHITGFTKFAVPFFAQYKRACMELKTKSTEIGNLKGLDHRGKTIVSWSLNTQRMAQKEELKAASIEARLEAARICQEWGYPLAFHLEPLFYYPEWEEDYRDLIKELFTYVKPESITWISLGGLRLIDGLKDFTENRFPKSSYLYEELVPGEDGKLRYLKILRLQLYQKISKWIREIGGQVPMYLCMESSSVWQKGIGLSFSDAEEADKFLGRKVLE